MSGCVNLLRSISHDLRTPLTSISGNASVLINNSGSLDENKKMQLYEVIYDDSLWLINRLKIFFQLQELKMAK